jgi:predicted nuclease with TOPRIM domain
MDNEQLINAVMEIKEQIGELSAKSKVIIDKLHDMSKKQNEYTERTIRLEENVSDLSETLISHLNYHKENEANTKEYISEVKAAIIGAITGSFSAFVLSILLGMIW